MIALVAAALILAVIGFVIAKVYASSITEPFFWVEGVSVWPTEIIRGIALFLAVFFLWRGVMDLRASRIKLSKDIGIDENEASAGVSDGKEEDKKCFEKCKRILKKYVRIFSCNLTEQGSGMSGKEADKPGKDGASEIKKVWMNYVDQSKWESRLIRVLAPMLVYLLLGYYLTHLFGLPNKPIRSNAQWLDALLFVTDCDGVHFSFVLCYGCNAPLQRLC